MRKAGVPLFFFFSGEEVGETQMCDRVGSKNSSYFHIIGDKLINPSP